MLFFKVKFLNVYLFKNFLTLFTIFSIDELMIGILILFLMNSIE